jgi:tRNA G18 (ribose-2'-O)-methylase SpoU
MRGYFGVGVEGISKAMNLGNLMRTAHAFGASFFFTIESDAKARLARHADTAASDGSMPFYPYASLEAFRLPKHCQLVGIEFSDEAVELPSFRHPAQAAYVLGSERGTLSPGLQALCAHVVKIPTGFCLNVATAGAIVIYDRAISAGRFAERPVAPGGPKRGAKDRAPPAHDWGKPILRTRVPGTKAFLD